MEKSIDLQTFDDDVPRNRGKGSIAESKGKEEFDNDRYELARVGKQQVLKVCALARDFMPRLISSAPLRTGKHDWSFMWVDVHMGDSARVSLIAEIEIFAKTFEGSFLLDSGSKCHHRSRQVRTLTDLFPLVAGLLVSYTASYLYGSAISQYLFALVSWQVQFLQQVASTIGYPCSLLGRIKDS